MPRNKSRLQLALYDRPKHPRSYHYALFVAPKSARGQITKHHVLNTLRVDDSGKAIQPWRYEQTEISDVETEKRLLVRITIAKVPKDDDVKRILRTVQIYQVEDLDKAKAQSFTCRTWVRDALQELERQGAISTKLERWEDLERMASEYLDRKRIQRRWSGSWKGAPGVPLMNLLEGREENE